MKDGFIEIDFNYYVHLIISISNMFDYDKLLLFLANRSDKCFQ